MSVSALLAHDLVRTLGSRRVLDGVSLVAAPGRRIGLIGENGTGKSTLLRLLAGVDRPDSGSVVRPESLGFLHQELPFPATASLADVVGSALAPARAALESLDRLAVALGSSSPAALDAYGEALETAEELEAWDADRRASLVLAGLGLGEVALTRTVGSLSGGERGRLALAALLIRRPAALLLDEPTNHLDDAALVFLEEQLRGMPGTVVVASHDRAFLDAVCTDLIDLDPAADGPTRFGGGYSAYLAVKSAERDRWQRRFEEEQEELGQLRSAVAVTAQQVAHGRPPRDSEKMGYGHTAGRVQQQISRRVRNASRRLEELERTQVRKPPAPLRFAAPRLAATSASGLLVSLRGIRVPGRLACDRLDISAGDRLLITGPNGVGKSTLLALLAGALDDSAAGSPAGRSAAASVPAGAGPVAAVEGDLQRRRGLRVALLAQDTTFDHPELTARDLYRATLGPDRADAVPLASLGLLPARAQTLPVASLSVGQRRRLALALVIADPPELLLLDEPTNHLSPRLADELEDAIGLPGPGAVVVASHDRWLRHRWPGQTLSLTPAG